MFSFYTLTDNEYAYFDLQMGNNVLCRAMTDGKANYDSVGCTAIIYLAVKDTVYVKLMEGSVYNTAYAHFTGVRIGAK